MQPDILPVNKLITAWCAICSYYGTELTGSVYVMKADDHVAAEKQAFDYFMQTRGIRFRAIKKIAILPQGKERFAGCEPVFIKEYEMQIEERS